MAYPGYRADIDGLRAIAVLSVVIFHAFPELLKAGFVGVDIFFVISGYLISGIIFKGLAQGCFSFRDFYARRIRRIFPALILVLTTALVLGWLVLRADEYKALARQVAWGAGFAGNILMKREAGYFDIAAELKPLLHLWSLGVEEQFYLFWPVCALLAFRRKISLSVLIAALFLISFALNVLQINDSPNAVFYSPFTRFWELWIGATLAHLDLRGGGSWLANFHTGLFARQFRDFVAWLGLSLFALALLAIDRHGAFPGWMALLPTLCAFCLIAAGPEAWVNRRILASPVAVWIGLISYPLYLWHWPLLSFLKILEQGEPSSELRMLAVVLALVLSWLTYVLVEKRLRFRLSWTTTAGLVVVMLLVVVAADQIKREQGVPERLAERVAMPKFETQEAFFHELSGEYPPCMPQYLQDKAEVQNGIIRCRQRLAEQAQTVALIGDSHAEHLFPGLAKYGVAQENLVYFSYPCLPFWGLTGQSSCGNVEAVLDHVLSSTSIHTVILTNFWQARSGEPDYRLIADLGQSDPDEIYKIALRQSLRKFQQAGKNIIFGLDVPLLGFLPGACQQRTLVLQKTARQPCAMARSEVMSQQLRYRTLTAEVLRDFPEVRVWDPMDMLCDEAWCYASANGIGLYRDANHISTLASWLLGKNYANQVSFKRP